MSDLGAATWSETDASNTATPPNGWPEGMFPSDVNNSARANMGGEKRWWVRSNSVFTTAGTTTAYTLTYAVAAASYYNGEEFSFIVNATCGAAPTLNINGLGARNLRKFVSGAFVNLAAADIVANQPIRVRYNLGATTFDIVSASVFVSPAAPTTWTPTDASGAGLVFTGVNAKYQVIGNMVFAYFRLTYPATASGLGAAIGGLPVTTPNQTYVGIPAPIYGPGGASGYVLPNQNATTASLITLGGATILNSTASGLTINACITYPTS